VTVPSDYANPEWDKAGKVHEWKNYIGERLQAIWHTFTDEQKQAIAESADDSAGAEEWE
jgi:hypothetical protein